MFRRTPMHTALRLGWHQPRYRVTPTVKLTKAVHRDEGNTLARRQIRSSTAHTALRIARCRDQLPQAAPNPNGEVAFLQGLGLGAKSVICSTVPEMCSRGEGQRGPQKEAYWAADATEKRYLVTSEVVLAADRSILCIIVLTQGNCGPALQPSSFPAGNDPSFRLRPLRLGWGSHYQRIAY
ncbi:hypothetical protein HYQ45_002551 [Verticillium longisporum]|uniref:Uncharacterized protein n=1 Tax=Verticillium longisporum TaxID=100787 RepID=A0A8I3AVR6_VERLO|nr:hypothetical protein HYQ45_002551 [Verticillium longisporum]